MFKSIILGIAALSLLGTVAVADGPHGGPHGPGPDVHGPVGPRPDHGPMGPGYRHWDPVRHLWIDPYVPYPYYPPVAPVPYYPPNCWTILFVTHCG